MAAISTSASDARSLSTSPCPFSGKGLPYGLDFWSVGPVRVWRAGRFCSPMAFSGAWMFSSFGSFSASLAAALLSQAPAAPDGGAAAPAQAPSIIDSLGMLPILVVITALFYFMLIRPQRREQATRQSMLDQLKKNDRVVTSGGLYGVVVNVHQGADEVTLRVDETSNTRVKVTRSSIVRVLGDEAVESTESKETK